MASSSITQWLQNLPIPWLVGETNGRADVTSYGTVLDGQVDLLKEAVKARMPGEAPSDALPYIGNDRKLIQGPNETDENFTIRLQTAWDDWARAGTAVELLTQLYWQGFTGAWLVQQNGIGYGIDTPVAGEDPTDQLQTLILGQNYNIAAGPKVPILITITTTGALGTMRFTTTVAGTTSVVHTTDPGTYFGWSMSAPVPYTRITFIENTGGFAAGDTYTIGVDGSITATGTGESTDITQSTAPWWTFDQHNDHCSRFAVVFPEAPFPSAMTTVATAVFDGTTGAVAVTWNNAFPDTTYHILLAPATVTDGGGPVAVGLDGGTKTQTGITVNASYPFVGTVELLAWQDGANPFADFHPADLARLKNIIRTWKPARALCVGIACIAQGRLWGWPVGLWATGSTWGPGSSVFYEMGE